MHLTKEKQAIDRFNLKIKSFKQVFSTSKVRGKFLKNLKKVSGKSEKIFDALDLFLTENFARNATALAAYEGTKSFFDILLTGYLSKPFKLVAPFVLSFLSGIKYPLKLVGLVLAVIKTHRMRLNLESKWALFKTLDSSARVKDLTIGSSLIFESYLFFLKNLRNLAKFGAFVVAFPLMMEMLNIPIPMSPQLVNLFTLIAGSLVLITAGITLATSITLLIKTSLKYSALREAKSDLNKQLELNENRIGLQAWVAFLRGHNDDLGSDLFKPSSTKPGLAGEGLKNFFILRQEYLLFKKELLKANVDIRAFLSARRGTDYSEFANKAVSVEALEAFKSLYNRYSVEKSEVKVCVGSRNLKLLISSVEHRESKLKGKFLERVVDLNFAAMGLAILVVSNYNPVLLAFTTIAFISWKTAKKWKKLPLTTGPILPFQKWGAEPLPIASCVPPKDIGMKFADQQQEMTATKIQLNRIDEPGDQNQVENFQSLLENCLARPDQKGKIKKSGFLTEEVNLDLGLKSNNYSGKFSYGEGLPFFNEKVKTRLPDSVQRQFFQDDNYYDEDPFQSQSYRGKSSYAVENQNENENCYNFRELVS